MSVVTVAAGRGALRQVTRQVRADATRSALRRERDVATGLREATRPVPPGPGELNGMQFTALHQAADDHAGVGGDWCDWQGRPDGRVLLTVGDVAGHGLPAVQTMVRLRHTVAALAGAGLAPADVLAEANRQLWRAGRAEMATALVAEYDPRDRRFRWASAGHLPVIFTDLLGEARCQWPPAGVMLGVDPDARYRCATVTLRRGQAAVLYTDGFVEQPTASIDDGIALLVAGLRRCRGADPRSRLRHGLGRVARVNPRDDACLLAALVTGA
jgi:hypothetical protein